MDGDPDFVQGEGVRAARAEDPDVRRQLERLRDLTLGVMISVQQEYGDLRGLEPSHLGDEEESGAVVLPVAVVEVARDHYEVHLLRNRETDQVLEGVAGRGTDPPRDVSLLPVKAAERAVQVDVGGVQETEARHVSYVTQINRTLYMKYDKFRRYHRRPLGGDAGRKSAQLPCGRSLAGGAVRGKGRAPFRSALAERCRPEAGVPSRPRASSPSAVRDSRPCGPRCRSEDRRSLS